MIELTHEQVALLIGTFALVVTGLVLSRFLIAGLRDKLGVEDSQTPEETHADVLESLIDQAVAKQPEGWMKKYGLWERRQICACCLHRQDAHYGKSAGGKRKACTECSCSTFEVAVGARTNPFAADLEAARERLRVEPPE